MIIIIKGIIIGMIVCFPIGPLGILSIQRIINRGWKVGFFSGLGAAVSDIVYSSTAVFGTSFIDNIICKHKSLINGITGVLFLIIGLKIFFNAIKNKEVKEESKKEILHPAFSNFLLGLSNPMTFLVFLTIFTKVGMKINTEDVAQNILFIVSIFLGSMIFWLLISNLINKSKRNFKIETFYRINKVIGTVITIFGVYSVTLGIFKI